MNVWLDYARKTATVVYMVLGEWSNPTDTQFLVGQRFGVKSLLPNDRLAVLYFHPALGKVVEDIVKADNLTAFRVEIMRKCDIPTDLPGCHATSSEAETLLDQILGR